MGVKWGEIFGPPSLSGKMGTHTIKKTKILTFSKCNVKKKAIKKHFPPGIFFLPWEEILVTPTLRAKSHSDKQFWRQDCEHPMLLAYQ